MEQHTSYQLKMDELQAKLRKSKIEHKELEYEFKKMMKERSERGDRNNSKRIIDEDRKRTDRNERLLQKLDRVDYQAAALAAKTERLKLLKTHYELYLLRSNMPPPQQLQQFNTHPIQQTTPIIQSNLIVPAHYQYQYPTINNQYQLPNTNLAKFLAQKNHLPFNDVNETKSKDGNFIHNQTPAPNYLFDPHNNYFPSTPLSSSVYPQSVISCANNNTGGMVYKDSDQFYRSLNDYDNKENKDVIYDTKSSNINPSTSLIPDDNDKTGFTNYTNQINTKNENINPHSIATQRLIDYNCQNNKQIKLDDMRNMYSEHTKPNQIQTTTSNDIPEVMFNNSIYNVQESINNSSIPANKSVSETRKINRDGVIENIHQIWEKVIDEDKIRFNNKTPEEKQPNQFYKSVILDETPKKNPMSILTSTKTIDNISNDKIHVQFFDDDDVEKVGSSATTNKQLYENDKLNPEKNNQNDEDDDAILKRNFFPKIEKMQQNNNTNDSNNFQINSISKTDTKVTEDIFYGDNKKYPVTYHNNINNNNKQSVDDIKNETMKQNSQIPNINSTYQNNNFNDNTELDKAVTEQPINVKNNNDASKDNIEKGEDINKFEALSKNNIIDNNNIRNTEIVQNYRYPDKISMEEIKETISQNNEQENNESVTGEDGNIYTNKDKDEDQRNLIKVDQQDYSYQPIETTPNENAYPISESDNVDRNTSENQNAYPENYENYTEYQNYTNPEEYQHQPNYDIPEVYQNPEDYQNSIVEQNYVNPEEYANQPEYEGSTYENPEEYQGVQQEFENPEGYENLQDYTNTQVYAEGENQQYQNTDGTYGNEMYPQDQQINIDPPINYDQNYDQSYTYPIKDDPQQFQEVQENYENHQITMADSTVQEPQDTYYGDEPGQNYYGDEQPGGNEGYYQENSDLKQNVQINNIKQEEQQSYLDNIIDDSSTTYTEEISNIPQPLIGNNESTVSTPILPQKEKKRVNFADSESDQSSEKQTKQSLPDDSDFDFSAS